jgi:hypothetical protein
MPYKSLFFTVLLALSLTTAAQTNSPRTLEWTDLMPEEDLELLLNMPTVDHGELSDEELAADLPGDSLRATSPAPTDPLADQIESAIGQAMSGKTSGERTWEDALVSTNVREEFDNTRIRLPGFIVPLEFDDDMNISEFFLVPYFGACIHVPPPPPNQIIHVRYAKGLQLEALYTPFWITGTLKTEVMENDMALAAYTMVADTIVEYED